MKTLIKNAVVVPMTETGPKYFTGSVAWEDGVIVLVAADNGDAIGGAADCAGVVGGGGADCDGITISRAVSVEEWLAANSDAQIIDGTGKLVMPGLVNTHAHAAMTLVRNAADDIPLMEWLEKHIWPFEAGLTADDIARGARIGFTEMLRGGTTTAVDMYWHEAAIGRVARELGIRAVLCPSFVDGQRMVEFEGDLVRSLEVAAAAPELLSVRIAPHAAYSCSEENLRRAVKLARKYDIGITVHVSETLDEQRIIRQRHGCTPTEYLDRLGVFDVPVIAAHCVHVTEGDMDILLARGVTVAHNPQSNMKIASGAAPVARMLERGINVSLGTDGAASNNDLDMFDEMRTASLLGKHTAADPLVLPAWEVLRMATVNGARALWGEGCGVAGYESTPGGKSGAGCGRFTGTIEMGSVADVIMLDTGGAHWQPVGNVVNALIYSAKSSDVVATWVNGRLIDC